MDTKRAYDQEGNEVNVYTSAYAVYMDDTKKETVDKVLSDNISEVENIKKSIKNLQDSALTDSDKANDFVDDPSKFIDAGTLKKFRDSTLCFKGVLTEIDLDTLIEPGYYFIEDATKIQHLPSDINSDFDNSFVIVLANKNNVYQKIVNIKGNIVSTRAKKETTDFSIWENYLNVKSTIPNKSKTALTLPNSMGSINYFIEDGWCTLEAKDIGGNGANIDILETEEIPVPNLTQPCILEHDGVMVGTIYVSGKSTGKGVKIIAHKNSEVLGYGTVSYKIDQSKY